MKVTFSYTPLSQSSPVVPLVLSLGERLSPVGPVQFAHTGAAQERFAIRADAKSYIGRGGGNTTETFIAQKEHATHWDAMIWTRVTLRAAMGHNGTLTYEGDQGGRIRLRDAVLVSAQAAPGLVGMTSFIQFTFAGGAWISG